MRENKIFMGYNSPAVWAFFRIQPTHRNNTYHTFTQTHLHTQVYTYTQSDRQIIPDSLIPPEEYGVTLSNSTAKMNINTSACTQKYMAPWFRGERVPIFNNKKSSREPCVLIAKWHLQVDVLRIWQEKITGCQAQGEGGQAYTGNSCSNEELIKVPGRKTGRAATRHSRSELAREPQFTE